MTTPIATPALRSLRCLITIVNQDQGERVARFYRQHDLNFNIICPGYGAPGTEMLDYLGLTEYEKDILISFGEGCLIRDLIPQAVAAFHFDRPNTGVLFSLPVVGISGRKALHYVTGDSERNETMQQSPDEKLPHPPAEARKYDLIVTVVNRGFADAAVEAAKLAGAQGGTIFYARGTGIHEVEKFFGIAIQPEKEVLLSLVRHNLTRQIMHEIVESAGLATPGRGLAFSLPVCDVAGIPHFQEICPIPPESGEGQPDPER